MGCNRVKNPGMHIGTAIRGIRIERGRTLEDVAFAAGTDASNLSRIERGLQRYTPEMLDRIAAVLDVAVSAVYLRAEAEEVGRSTRQRDGMPSPENEALLMRFGRLTPDNKALAMDFLKFLLRRQGAEEGERRD